ncbi:MAG: GNAT family N-acetyltransferase [Burkholderiales bacterium]
MKRERHLYGLSGRSGRSGSWRASLRTPAARCRPVTAADAEALAALMYEAYLGTIDDEGESRDDALTEIHGFFAGKYGAPIAGACLVVDRDGGPAAAALICDWNERHQTVAGPLVAYVLVHPGARGQGLGTQVMNAVLTQLADACWGRVFAVITEGNAPSEALFGKLGFSRIDD